MQNSTPHPERTTCPSRIARLEELAYNLWWSWHPEALRLFRDIDPELWESDHHNPARLLQRATPEKLQAAAEDPEYLAHYDAVLAAFDAYMNADQTWFATTYPELAGQMVAYFSAEFGLHECLPLYSGGLGILSGDHCKEASDLGVPFVGVGFLYPQGYFKQRINEWGEQEAFYSRLNMAEVPARPATTSDGGDVIVAVDLPGRRVYARVWRIQVGRVPLFLLDTDVEPNAPEDRELAARLYHGDEEIRISQEIVLGIGGVRALRELGIEPAVWHINEGHPAFMTLERVRYLVHEVGLSFREAREVVRASTVFTTHTPVAAGHDTFPFELMDRHFAHYWPQMGLDRDGFMALGYHEQPWGARFSMTVLALKLSGRHNGVSELHGHVSRKMWHFLWPDRPVDQVPIGHITNGVHTATWVAPAMAELFDTYLGPEWRERVDDPIVWRRVAEIPDDALWEVRQSLKQQAIEYLRRRMQAQNGAAAAHLLDPDALLIGFARRFATYKRATLIFHDPQRLRNILNAEGRPVQIIYAGKAHPADEPGKALIRRIHELAREPGFAGRIFFVEDYDIEVARCLVQGVDLWLNNPRRPLEASGTSGQKAALNGVPNFSVLDGWWNEAYNGENGWAIGDGQEYPNDEEQDAADARSLYKRLENEIIPAFFERDERGIPPRWLGVIRESIRTVAPAFSTRRMVKEYIDRMYVPAAREAARLVADDYVEAHRLALRKHRMREA